jgi:hypothetical protein
VESNAKILADVTWLKQQGDCELCAQCKEMMVSGKNVLAVEMEVGGKKHTEETKIRLCNACYELNAQDG